MLQLALTSNRKLLTFLWRGCGFLASDLLDWAKLGHQVHKVNQKKAKFRNINANYGLKHNPEVLVLVRMQILSVGGSGCC